MSLKNTPAPERTTALRPLDDLRGYRLRANDGGIGKILDSYFDDKDWRLRYFVVDTGAWLERRPVLISPICCGHPEQSNRQIPVSLSRDKVKNSPDVDLARPVSRQLEIELHTFHGWPFPWGLERARRSSGPLGNSQLRSVREVLNYAIVATDGEIGHVEELIVDVDSWAIRYIVVDTRNWLPGRKVLVSPAWISEIQWPEGRVAVDLRRDAIKESPTYDPSAPIYRDQEVRLHEHFDRPTYW